MTVALKWKEALGGPEEMDLPEFGVGLEVREKERSRLSS
jgi:hypothetical protein